MQHQAEYLRKDAAPDGHGDMYEHMAMMQRRHIATLWCHFVNIALGCWLIASPAIFGYGDIVNSDLDLARVAAERNIPDVAMRAAMMSDSDIVSGLLVVLFAILSLRRFGWAQWGNCVVGLWLMFAPLLFWTPSPASYGNDLLLGGLIIAFAVLVPMMPGMSMEGMMQKASIPPGWEYCPSTWLQRLPIAALALLGVLLAHYLAAYQLGHIEHAWDPFFGRQPNGTETIITSSMSKAWPVPDAGVGAMAYMIELLMAVMGDARRWRTMPWMVAAFGIVVVPLGAVSIFFIIAQPIFIGTWCTLCLLQALAMLVMMPYALDELVAMGQFLKASLREGKPFWRTFFTGGAMHGAYEDDAAEFEGGTAHMLRKGATGVTLTWGLTLTTLLGVWLMCTRLIFGATGALANSDHLMGSLLITFSVLAMAEVARPLRFLNIPVGIWVVASPWMLPGASSAATIASVLVGLVVVIASLPRGVIHHRYAGWNALLC